MAKKEKRKVGVDMTGVDTFAKAPEGMHTVKITKAEFSESQGGNDIIKVRFEVTKGKAKGTSIIESYSLAENALWKLKGLLQALGMKADGKIKLDLDKMEGKTLDVLVVHEEYNGQYRAKISEAYKLGQGGSQKDEDEDEDEDDDDTDESEEDEDEDSEDDEDDEDEDDEEEETKKESSKKKSSKGSKKGGKKSDKKKSSKGKKKKDEDEDEDDDDGWEDDDE